eukprot:tig00000507_g1770.t1
MIRGAADVMKMHPEYRSSNDSLYNLKISRLSLPGYEKLQRELGHDVSMKRAAEVAPALVYQLLAELQSERANSSYLLEEISRRDAALEQLKTQLQHAGPRPPLPLFAPVPQTMQPAQPVQMMTAPPVELRGTKRDREDGDVRGGSKRGRGWGGRRGRGSGRGGGAGGRGGRGGGDVGGGGGRGGREAAAVAAACAEEAAAAAAGGEAARVEAEAAETATATEAEAEAVETAAAAVGRRRWGRRRRRRRRWGRRRRHRSRPGMSQQESARVELE